MTIMLTTRVQETESSNTENSLYPDSKDGYADVSA